MKLFKASFALCLLLLIAAVVLAVQFSKEADQTKLKLQSKSKQLSESQKQVDDMTEALENRAAALRESAFKTAALTNDLNKAAQALKAAGERIHGYEEAERAQAELVSQEQEHQRILDQVPPPTITTNQEPSGRIIITIVFPEVRTQNNWLLATNALFTKQYGRHIAFKPDNGAPFSVDVDEIHPAILDRLGINAESAKIRQRIMDIQWQQKLAYDLQNAKSQAELDAQNQERRDRIQIARDQANAEIAKLQAEQRAKDEWAYNQRLQAQAAWAAANKQPDNITVNQNQNIRYNSPNY